MNAAFTIPVVAITVIVAFALYVFIVDFLIHNHNAKTKAKQAAKERRKIESLFDETPTGFLQRGSEERHCKTVNN